MEKQITLTDLKAVFVKNFETFSQMDPFLVFKIGNSEGKTETADDAGKEPVWKENVTLVYVDETHIEVQAFEEDLTSNDLLGWTKIDVNTLKTSGELSFKLDSNGETIGTVTCNYKVKTNPPAPMLFVKNIKCDFFKETKFMLKTKPYFGLKCGEKSVVTDVIEEEGDDRKLAWDETLTMKIKDGDQLHFNVYDKEDNENKIFGYETTTKEFRTLSGSKQFNVIDKAFQPLGTLSFDYETNNFVNKEESIRNEEAAKKSLNQMNLITIEKIKGKLNEEGEDIYFKVALGPNSIRTPEVQNAKKDFQQQLGQQFYAEKKENKIVFAAYDKDTFSDDFLGAGNLELEGIATGQRVVPLHNKEGKHFGDIIVFLKVKKVVCKSIEITDIKVKLTSSADIIGQSEPYIISRVGGWSARTETGDANEYSFKKKMELKFSQQTELTMEVWDEDLNDNDRLFLKTVKLADLKGENGDLTIPLQKEDKQKGGQLSFHYTTKNVVNKQQDSKKDNDKKKPSTKNLDKNVMNKQKKSEKKISNQKIEPKKKEVEDDRNIKFNKSEQKREENVVQTSNQQSPRYTEKNELDRSNNNSIKLPSIRGSKNYGDKIFENQSAATLQLSILVYSVPKANRFAFGPKYQGEPSYYVDSAFKPNSGRGVGFGFGSKRQIPDWLERNMKENPAPGAYFDHHNNTSPGFRQKGPTFGIGYKHYEKVMIPHQKSLPKSTNNLKPLKTRRPMKLNQ